MARLARHVHVHHQGGSTVFGPDDEVPDWAAKLITAPDAWADEPGVSKGSAASARGGSESASGSEAPAKRSPGRPPKSEQQR